MLNEMKQKITTQNKKERDMLFDRLLTNNLINTYKRRFIMFFNDTLEITRNVNNQLLMMRELSYQVMMYLQKGLELFDRLYRDIIFLFAVLLLL
jgi:hypothetical protein